MNKDKLKKELLPIIALLVFIVVVLILCAISAGRRKREAALAEAESQTGTQWMAPVETESGPGTEDGEDAIVSGEAGTGRGESGTEISRETAEGPVEVRETIELEGEVPAEGFSEGQPSGGQESGDGRGNAPDVSANTLPVETVKKTNMEMLAEMLDYWSRENVEAVQDLSGLSHYRAMSASLQGPSYFYYYGEKDGQGRPDGTGIAVYGGDQYYYGGWKNGMRDGEGMWLRMYYAGCRVPAGVNTLLNTSARGEGTNGAGKKEETEPDPALICHSYRGSWKADLPEGEGHEQFEIDTEKAEKESVYFQNVMGNFHEGLYDGEMYLITADGSGNTREWNGTASCGTFESHKGRDQEGRVPVCQAVQDPDSHLWISPLSNREQGIAELRAQKITGG